MILKVMQKKDETSNASSLILEKPEDFKYYPGQYLDIQLPVNDPLGKTRAFTISSSPTEDFLMLCIKKGLSIYKNHLLKLSPGDYLNASHPVGTFILDENTPAIMLAGGIGITPFRSMIKFVLDQKLTTPITLIYSNSNDDFVFKHELDSWQKSLPNLQIIYRTTNTEGRLMKLPPTTYKQPIYYLAGSPGFVDAIEKMLQEMGIDETNIRFDRFDGY